MSSTKDESRNAFGIGDFLTIQAALEIAEQRAGRQGVKGAYTDTLRRVKQLLADKAALAAVRKVTAQIDVCVCEPWAACSYDPDFGCGERR